MPWLSILILLVVAIILVFIWIKNQNNNDEDEEIDEEAEDMLEYYYIKDGFLSQNERNFYHQLVHCLEQHNEGFLVFAQTRLADIFGTNHVNTPEGFGMFNRIKSKHIDFIITDISGDIRLCIELDDSTHDISTKSDEFKDKLMEVMEMPFLRIKTQKRYDMKEIEDELGLKHYL